MNRLLIALTLLLSTTALSSVPASAGAADISMLGGLWPQITDNSAIVDASPNKVKVVDLRNGAETVFATPTQYVDRPGSVLKHGYFAATGESFDAANNGTSALIVSGPKGGKTLVSWKTDFTLESYRCRSGWYPLAVDRRGQVTALQVTLGPGPTSSSCSVKLSETRLVRFGQDGSRTTLYLPDKYKRWLSTSNPFSPRATFDFRGDRLAMFQVRPHYRVAVLNIRKKTATEFSPGKKLGRVAFASANSLLVTRDTGLKVVAKRFSTSGRPGRTIYSGASAGVTTCGTYAAITTRNWIDIRDRNGKRVFRRVPKASYEDGPGVACSGSYLFFQFADQGCSQCGAMPFEHELLELGKLK